MHLYNPEPNPGLQKSHFTKISQNGFGDGYNAYAYSMAWFKDRILVGVGRANLQLLKIAMPFVTIDQWPVEVPFKNYTPEFEREAARGEIWSYDPTTTVWTKVHESTMMTDREGVEFRRHLGYRAMTIFQGKSDAEPALYAASWARSRGEGPELLRSIDGKNFELMPKLHFRSSNEEVVITAIRVLVPFKGKLFTAPTGSSKGNVNCSYSSLIYETDDPTSGEWRSVNEPGFEAVPVVATVYEMQVFGDYLYAGTGGIEGFQVWRTKAEGKPPYQWEKVLSGGAGRGALNQGTVAMKEFNGYLYIGTGIQNGGYDMRHKIGPAAAEIIRIDLDGNWDIVVGNGRDGRLPISGLSAGFENYFAGYLWRMCVHDGWLYATTLDWSIILKFTKLNQKPGRLSQVIWEAGVDELLEHLGGFELWRTHDGENWVHVTKNGFGNPFNYGGRTMVSTPHGMFLGTANPFGPRVAVRTDEKRWEWEYRDNPDGGLEVWLGDR